MPKKRILSTILRLEIPFGTGPLSRSHQGGEATSELKALLVMTPPSWLAESCFHRTLAPATSRGKKRRLDDVAGEQCNYADCTSPMTLPSTSFTDAISLPSPTYLTSCWICAQRLDLCCERKIVKRIFGGLEIITFAWSTIRNPASVVM
jgi:hypothetical protein